MNPVSGRIVEIYIEGGTTKAKVSVGGAHVRVMMTFLMDARVGDEVLIESGLALSTLKSAEAKEESYVLGDSR
jgi:hydrogenase maturation factor